MFLGSSVFFAIQDAVAAARRDRGLAEDFTVRSPATPEQIRMACEDRFTEMVRSGCPSRHRVPLPVFRTLDKCVPLARAGMSKATLHTLPLCTVLTLTVASPCASLSWPLSKLRQDDLSPLRADSCVDRGAMIPVPRRQRLQAEDQG